MNVAITYFVHSTSLDNEAGIRSGWSDVALSLKGQRQALRLRERNLGNVFSAVFCSDLARAQSTAQIAFPTHSVITDSRLREMNYGRLNGTSGDQFPAAYSNIDIPFPDGESCLDVENRMRGFLADRAVNYIGETIAIVSHKFPQLALDVVCGGKTWAQAIDDDWRNVGKWQAGWHYNWSL